jgi:hypothetical protein
MVSAVPLVQVAAGRTRTPKGRWDYYRSAWPPGQHNTATGLAPRSKGRHILPYNTLEDLKV